MKHLSTLALALLCTAPVAAQTKAPAKAPSKAAPAHVAVVGAPLTAEGVRQLALDQLAYDRSVLIKMADSMPEQFYTESVTPIQRTFAQQIIHCAWAVNAISMMSIHAAGAAGLDSAAALTTRAGLKAYVNGSFDAATAFAKAQTAAQRSAQADVFGKKMQGWQVWEELHQHTMWTAGQVVANFRAHGMAPPEFQFF
jgi:hypothetical protein